MLVVDCLLGFFVNYVLLLFDLVIVLWLWIGNKVIMLVYFDEYYNIVCVVVGCWCFMLFVFE